MFDLEIDKKQMKELETFFSTSPDVIEKALKYARKKAGERVKKLQREASEQKYINSKKTLNNQTHKIKNNAKETIITALSKSSKLQDFYISNGPTKNTEALKGQVLKSKGKTKMKTMFWGFYKKEKNKFGLFIRNSDKRTDLSKVRSPSPFTMGQTNEHYNLLIEDEIQVVFFEALEESIYKELG